MKRILVWQWGRRGGGPRFGLNVAQAIARLPGREVTLSLSRRAEVLDASDFDLNTVPLWLVETYGGFGGLVARLLGAPAMVQELVRGIRAWRPDFVICAMTGPIDLLMVAALRWLRVPFAVIVHDALPHPGDGFPFQHMLQNMVIREADVVVALTQHVARQLHAVSGLDRKRIVVASLPPFTYSRLSHHSERELPERAPGPIRLLMFGRLLAYKGIDLLIAALEKMPETMVFNLRVVGSGPETVELRTLAAMPGVTVENRWVPEDEIASLISWADVMVLPYREASQSGVGAVALAAGKQVLATRVGGLEEQFGGEAGVSLCAPEAASLTQALQEVIRNGPRAGETPSRSFQQWEAMAARMLADIEAEYEMRSVVHTADAVASIS